MEIHEVIDAKLVKNYTVEFVFDDLSRGQVDLKKYLGKGIFSDLLSPRLFKKFQVDAELGTIAWFNGADIAPETLYEEVQKEKRKSHSVKN
jgi:hypothetical protein